MSNSHGDLFGEIGKLVLAANSGQAIDLRATAKDLAQRYQNLGISEETITATITRSIGAISIGMARVARRGQPAAYAAVPPSAVEKPAARASDLSRSAPATAAKPTADLKARKAKSPFPSGVRLALLS